MALKALITVGGYEFPEPSTYSGSTSTLVDSGRNTAGVTVGSVIRDDVGKVEVSWKYLTIEQWANILKCFSIARGGSFYNSVTFFCQDIGGWTTREMYVSDRSAGMWRRDPETGDVLGWTDCKLSLVEV
jgi:hypothetical protein